MTTKYNIKIDVSKDSRFDPISLDRLKDSYMTNDESSPQERFAYVSEKFSSNIAHAQRMYQYVSDFWIGYSTPILSFGRSNAGLPISCFLCSTPDSKEGLVNTLSETNWLSMMGGGVGVYWGVRGQDEKSVGVIPHMKVYDAACLAYKQGSTRRGSYAMYLDICHPDIIEFLEMRKETGDQRRKCLNLHHGVCIPDAFMHLIEEVMKDEDFDDSWELKDPISGLVHEVVRARDLWERLITLRAGDGRGEPYILWIDTVNNALPQHLKDVGYVVIQSNLCSEILQRTNDLVSAVCCLSSINLDKWDEYKDNYQFFRDVMEFLDNVLQYFIDNAPDVIHRARRSAVEERSVGLGVMGFHSYLQKHNIPFESIVAKSHNIKIFKTMKAMVNRANMELGQERGSPELLQGTGLRFALTTAIAPTATNALICGNVSPSIEPLRANIFRQDTLSGSFTQKNKYLDELIQTKHSTGLLDYDATWLKIISTDGSIQGMDVEFTEHEQFVFKTAAEIDQLWAVEHVADRQPEVDQGQSFNTFIKPDITIPHLHAIHFHAWKRGVKTMYYCRSEKAANADRTNDKVVRERLDEVSMMDLINDDVCVACQ
jgi:ribonucleoside-diphosphate reductase alpha chain